MGYGKCLFSISPQFKLGIKAVCALAVYLGDKRADKPLPAVICHLGTSGFEDNGTFLLIVGGFALLIKGEGNNCILACGDSHNLCVFLNGCK